MRLEIIIKRMLLTMIEHLESNFSMCSLQCQCKENGKNNMKKIPLVPVNVHSSTQFYTFNVMDVYNTLSPEARSTAENYWKDSKTITKVEHEGSSVWIDRKVTPEYKANKTQTHKKNPVGRLSFSMW